MPQSISSASGRWSVAAAWLCALVSTSCATGGFTKPVLDFQEGVAKTAEGVSIYYLTINSFERELYLQERLLNPELRVDTQVAFKPTALSGQTFSAESIKARTDAIALVGLYGKRLAALAGSDAPREIAEGIKAAGDSFKGLVTTLSEVADDSTASKYVSPVSSLVGLVAQSILEARRDKLLTEAVTTGAPAVRSIVSLLKTDLETVIGPQRVTGTAQARSNLIARYNDKRSELSDAERREALEEIRMAQERYEAAVVFRPTDLLSSLGDAHEALVKYAMSHRDNPDAAELAAALDVFRSKVTIAAAEISAIKKLKGGGN